MHARRTLLALVAVLSCAALAGAQSLTTLFASNNQGGRGWSMFFDLEVDVGVSVTALDVNTNSALPMWLEVHLTPEGGTHVGNETAGVWTLAATSQTVLTAGPRNATHCPLLAPLDLDPGTYGVAIHYRDGSPYFTNANPVNTTYSNRELTLVAGSVLAGAPGTANNVYAPRVWNGTIHYVERTGFALALPFGSGCGGGGPATFYERFDAANPFDLTSGFDMLYAGGDEYAVIAGFSPFVPPVGAPLALLNDETLQVALPWSMPTVNGTTDRVWVCSNGWVGLRSTASTSENDNIVDLVLRRTRVCALWDHLDVEAPGAAVYAFSDTLNPAKFHVTWSAVREEGPGGGGASTFQVSFDQSGSIAVNYASVSISDCLVGYSHGDRVVIPPQTDLSDPLLGFTTGDDRPPPSLVSTARPALGATAALETRDLPPNTRGLLLFVGFLGLDPGFPLDGIGMPGCSLFSAGDLAVLPFAVGGPTVGHAFPIGNDQALVGLQVFLQSVIDVPGVNQLGLATSNGLAWTVDGM